MEFVCEETGRFMVGIHLCAHCINLSLGWIALAIVFNPIKAAEGGQ